MPIYSPKCHCMEIITYFSIIARWRATSHTSVAFWKNANVRPPSMRKRTSSCAKSFTTSDNNKVNCAQMLPVKKNCPQTA